ncbi:hypothetical protein ALC60_09937, partial [Trachymyrmex zeteki]
DVWRFITATTKARKHVKQNKLTRERVHERKEESRENERENRREMKA